LLSGSDSENSEADETGSDDEADDEYRPDVTRKFRPRRRPPSKRQKLRKEEKKTSGSTGARARGTDYEMRAKAVAMLDTIPKLTPDGQRYRRGFRLAEACNRVTPKLSSPATLQKWATKKGRAKIVKKCGAI
jgi:hypothetical protein